jgi:hypothetical protein
MIDAKFDAAADDDNDGDDEEGADKFVIYRDFTWLCRN